MTLPCTVCGGPTRPWLEMPIDGKTFKAIAYGKISRCIACGHGCVFPLPNSAEVPAFYDLDEYYTQGGSHIPDVKPAIHDKLLTKLAWKFDEGVDLNVALSSLQIPAKSNVCEIGCGHAENLVHFKRLGHVAIGVDPDPKAAAKAAKSGIEVLQGTGEILPAEISAIRFDLVIMSHSLEHCIDPVLALKNVEAILRPGGVFVCEVPNSACTHFLWNNVCSEMFDAPRHLHFYGPTSLLKSIDNARLVTELVEYTGFTRHHAPGWRATELKIRRNLKRMTQQSPPPHSFMRSLYLWLRTFKAPAHQKYDSVRIVARKPLASAG